MGGPHCSPCPDRRREMMRTRETRFQSPVKSVRQTSHYHVGPLKTSRLFAHQMLIVFNFVSSSPTDCSAVHSELRLEVWLLTGEMMSNWNFSCWRFLSSTRSDRELSLGILFFLSWSPQGKCTSLWCKKWTLSKSKGDQKKSPCSWVFKCGFTLTIRRSNQL